MTGEELREIRFRLTATAQERAARHPSRAGAPGLTQGELARRLGHVGPTAISIYESGKRVVPRIVAERVAKMGRLAERAAGRAPDFPGDF